MVTEAWAVLERSEKKRNVALRDALKHLEYLKQLAEKFERKADLREAWLADTAKMLGTIDFGADLAAVEASAKREDAIETEVRAYEDRLTSISGIVAELVRQNYAGSAAVEARQANVSRRWSEMIAQLNHRRLLLNRALTLERATADANAALDWIAEMTANLGSENRGRNLDDVNRLIEANATAALDIAAFRKTSLLTINDHISEMEAEQHPDLDALLAQKDTLVASFDACEASCRAREAELGEGLEFRKFERGIADEDVWIRERLSKASSTELGASVSTVVRLIKAHRLLEAESLSHHETSVSQLIATGQALLHQGHYAAAKISAQLDWLSKAWSRLESHQNRRSEALDNALQSEQHRAGSNEATSWINEKMQAVGRDDYGRDFHASQSLLRTHIAVEEEIAAFYPTIEGLKVQSMSIKSIITERRKSSTSFDVITASNRTPSPTKSASIVRVKAAYSYTARKKKELTVAQGDVLEVVSSKDAKWWKVRSPLGEGYVPATYVKVIEEEPSSPAVAPDTGTASTSSMVSCGDPAKNARAQQDTVESLFAELKAAADVRHRMLQETSSFFEFILEAGELENWMEDMLGQASSTKTGDDVEQAETIRKAFENFRQDLKTNAIRKEKVGILADELCSAGHSRSEAIRARSDTINQRWEKLNTAVAERDRVLDSAAELTRYVHAAEEARGWIGDKLSLMPTDLGSDLAQVHRLVRAHDAFDSDIAALGMQASEIEKLATDLIARHPEDASSLEALRAGLTKDWANLKAASVNRTAHLNEALELHAFLSDIRDLESWLVTTTNEIEAVELAVDVSGARTVLERHQALRSEMDARTAGSRTIVGRGEDIVGRGGIGANDAMKKLTILATQQDAIETLWASRMVEFGGCLDFRELQREAETIEAWAASRERVLEDKDLGSSLDAVDSLSKKHFHFENSLMVYADAFDAFASRCSELIAAGNANAPGIAALDAHIKERRVMLNKAACDRRVLLDQSLQLQNFLQSCNECKVWIREGMQKAGDECYKDPANINGKLQEHSAFILAIDGYRNEIDSLSAGAAQMKSPEVYDSARDAAAAAYASVESAWIGLQELAADKSRKLTEVHQEQGFKRLVEDLDAFCAETEAALQTDELGSDLTSADVLLKKHERLMSDVNARESALERLRSLASELTAAGNFRAPEIASQEQIVAARYASIATPLNQRLSILKQSLELQSLWRSLDEERIWAEERSHAARAAGLPKDLLGALRTLKLHEVFDAQVTGHVDVLDSVLASGRALQAQKHYAAPDISQRLDSARAQYDSLVLESRGRLELLVANARSQRFFVDVAEAKLWIIEKMPLASSSDYGDDSDATALHRAKHDTLQADFTRHGVIVAEHLALGTALVAEGHFDAVKVASEVSDLESSRAELLSAVASRAEELDKRDQVTRFAFFFFSIGTCF